MDLEKAMESRDPAKDPIEDLRDDLDWKPEEPILRLLSEGVDRFLSWLRSSLLWCFGCAS